MSVFEGGIAERSARLLDRVRSADGVLVVTLVGSLFLVAASVDVLEPRARVAVLYLLPPAIAALRLGTRTGLAVGAAATLLAVGVDVFAARGTWAVVAWNTISIAVLVAFGVGTVGWLEGARRDAERSARTDPLTGLGNFRVFQEAAQHELARMRRTGEPLSVAYVDLDDFKLVNDVHGHAEGDAMLREAAMALRSASRDVDVIVRIGGDEFVVLLVGTDEAGAEIAASRLRAALAFRFTDRGWPTIHSIGTATFEEAPQSVDELLSTADAAMYVVKRRRRARLTG